LGYLTIGRYFKNTETNKIIREFLFKNFNPDILKDYEFTEGVRDGKNIYIKRPSVKSMKKLLEKVRKLEGKERAADLFSSICSKYSWVFRYSLTTGDDLFFGFNKKYTLDDVAFIFNGNPTKKMLSAILDSLDIKNSSKEIIMKYIFNGKIEPYRFLGGNTLIQFSKEELLSIIENENFVARRSIPFVSASCNLAKSDTTNRYRLLRYQDNIDEEIFNKVFETVNDVLSKDKLKHLTKLKKFNEKIEKFDEIKLWFRLQI
jgi:hypothetical protein